LLRQRIELKENLMPAATTSTDAALAAAVRDGIARAVAIVGLAGVALIHLLDLPGTFDDQAYKGWLYIALITGTLLTAATLVRSSDPRAWLAAAALPLGAVAGYVWSRTIGLPGGADDIGNWTEPLGLASLFVEGSLVAVAAAVLRARQPEAVRLPMMSRAG
jgi:hypothetical protein